MAGIYVQKLNPKLKQNIADKAYNLSEMAQIRKKAETQIGTGMIFRVCAAGTACIGSIVLAAVWVAGIGLIKYQFNHAVRKAYPGHPELLL